MGSKRIGRISEEVKKIVSNLILNQIKDPRISPFTSVTEVKVTGDLRYAKIYVSVLGDEKVKEDTLKGLQSATGFIRKEIGQNINLRYTPEPLFTLDDSIERGIYMTKLIEKVSQEKNDTRSISDDEEL